MITAIIVFFLIFTGGLAVVVVIASTMLDRSGRKICPKCGHHMRFVGIRGHYAYYKCSNCGKKTKEKCIIEHE